MILVSFGDHLQDIELLATVILEQPHFLASNQILFEITHYELIRYGELIAHFDAVIGHCTHHQPAQLGIIEVVLDYGLDFVNHNITLTDMV